MQGDPWPKFNLARQYRTYRYHTNTSIQVDTKNRNKYDIKLQKRLHKANTTNPIWLF